MQSSAWAALLRHMPNEIHHNLMVVTRGGTEIAIQAMLRIDHEWVAIKGRLAGTQEAGRVFFVAYDQIDYFGFQQPTTDREFQELFGNLVMPEPMAVTPAAPRPAPEDTVFAAARAAAYATTEPEAESEEEEPQEKPAQPVGSGSRTVNPAIKSAVLERFRARSQGGTGSGVRPPARG